MPRRTQDAGRGTKPFRSLEDQAFTALRRAADRLLQGVTAVVKAAGLSPPQYHVLRILRAAPRSGLSCREIGERMITKDPDVTRLLDRLEDRGMVVRSRERADRRIITVRITEEGLRTLASLDRPMLALQTRQFGALGPDGLQSLIALLERAQRSWDATRR
jgi:DNA-binding MarR family transcriptional regulator